MKKLFTLLAAVIITSGIYSQSPEKLSYQAVVRNSGGALVQSSSVGIKISILQTSAGGTAVYAETHTVITNANGLATLEIGNGSVVSGSFTGIDWSAGPYFLKTETDPTGGTSYTITGTSQLLSVPYAMHAKTAESTNSYTETDPVFTGHASNGISSVDISNWSVAYGWGNHSLAGYLSSESDPQVGANTLNFMPKWDGSALVTGTIYDNGNVGIGTMNPISKLNLDGPATSVFGISLGSENLDLVSGSRYIGLAYGTNIDANSGFSGIEFGGPASFNEGYLAFHTHDLSIASGERMRIDKSGNIGIGTTSPAYPLHVTRENVEYPGIALFEDNGVIAGDPNTYVWVRNITGDQLWGFKAADNGDWGLHQASYADRIHITTTGKVGIGTDNPSEQLQVNGNLRANGYYMEGVGWLSATPGTSVWTESGPDVYRSGGNMGIGTTSAEQRLNVNGNIVTSIGSYWIGRFSDANAARIRLSAGGHSGQYYPYTNGNDPWVWYYEDWTTEMLRLHPNIGGGNNASLTFTGSKATFSGDVGIGTTEPQVALHINSPGHPNIMLTSDANPGAFARYAFNKDTPHAAISVSDGTTTTWDALNIIANGNVGIGTTNPGAELEVAGQIKITGGAPGVDKVLTSDANGLASWETPTGGGGTHYLGEDFGGGIIFYIYKGSDGLQHGLIVAKTESTAQWQSTASLVNANRTWDGVYNMNLMINSPAKTYVEALGAGWYLPSIDELNILWQNRFHVNKAMNDGGFTLLSMTNYWSSTEDGAGDALSFYFNGGYPYTGAKVNTVRVRAVSAF